jgi:hypothetical protein
MKFAFADPPYIGQARKHYGCPEVDHRALIRDLFAKYPDGWALSCSSPSLWTLCPMVNDIEPTHDCRIGGWFKPFASFKPNVNPAYAWEPVIWRGGRRPAERAMRVHNEHRQYIPTVRDWVSASITLKKGLAGAKPPKFCDWVFDLLGATDEDELDDLFPGTGIVTARWNARRGKLALSGTAGETETGT